MGGNSCKQYGVGRLNKENFDLVIGQLDLIFLRYLPGGVRLDYIQSIGSKETFGDLDIVYSSTQPFNIKSFLENHIKILGDSKNWNINSLAIETVAGPFQVDFIRVQPQEFDFALAYFNYNDLGNLLGRVFHKAGFKLGWDGLRYVVRNPECNTHILDEIVVTLDWENALEFMGYENYYEKEFNTLEDLFLYTASSPYFNREIYLLENRNNTARTRDRKRPTYNAFLKWLDSEGTMIELPQFDWSFKLLIRRIFLEKAKGMFIGFEDKLIKIDKEMERQKLIHSKFNGNLVREWTGLEGMDLGIVIEKFKNQFISKEEFERVILNTRSVKHLFLTSQI